MYQLNIDEFPNQKICASAILIKDHYYLVHSIKGRPKQNPSQSSQIVGEVYAGIEKGQRPSKTH